MIIAIVGAPLSGKTTLLKRLQENGARVFSADSFVAGIYKQGQEGYELIKEQLGEEFVNPNEVNRRAVAEWIAEDESNLNKLNEMIHPLIFNYLEGKDNFIAELPIVSNSHIKFKYDKLLLVKANDETMIERFNNSKLRNPEFIKKIIEDWNNEIDYDIVVDTTNGIKEEDISNIIKLINE